jgi:O-antigen/teichoic acid export membrane protein
MTAQAPAIPHAPTLKERVLRAGGWNFAGHGLSQAIRLCANLILTRLLVPEMFGVMAIATLVTVILSMLSDIGLRQNIVRSHRGDDPDFLDTAWSIQVLRGIALWLLAVGLSVGLHFANLHGMLPAESVYASPVLPLVIAVTSLSAVISGLRSTKWATAFRHFHQKRIAQIELIALLVATAVSVAMGAATRSIWALVAGGLVAPLITTALSHAWMSGHANRWRWERNALRELFHLGRWALVSSFVGVLAASGDRLLLGGFVDTHMLGLYAIATLIVGAIAGGVGRLIVMVLLPALGEIARKEPARLREAYYRLRYPVDLLLLFVAGALFASGQLVIDLLYDSRYAGAGGMLQVLALSCFMVRYEIANQTYVAVGLWHYQAFVNALGCASLYTLVPILYWLAGTQAAIWGIALHAVATLPLVFYFNARLGLNDLRREAAVLWALPAGWLCGTALNWVAGYA